VRISGDSARDVASALLRFPAGTEWVPRHASLGELIDDAGAVVDQVVATWFAAPRSYTGEDVVEIACHGAPVVLRFCVEQACRPVPASPNRANSRYALLSTVASTSRKPKPSATSSTPQRSIKPASPPARSKAPSRAC